MTIRSIEIVPLGYARPGSALYYVIILFRALASVREQKLAAAGFVSQSNFHGGGGRKQSIF